MRSISFFLFALSFIFISNSLHAQENSFSEKIDFLSDPYTIDNVAFELVDIHDSLPNPNLLGTVYFGESKELYNLILDPDLKKQFQKFFKQALKKSSRGKLPTVIVFNKLSVNDKKNDSLDLRALKASEEFDRRVRNLGTKNWKNREYRVSVDYLINKKLIYSDSAQLDTIAHISEYSIDQFCTEFFKHSLHGFNQKLNELKLDSNFSFKEEEVPEEEEEEIENDSLIDEGQTTESISKEADNGEIQKDSISKNVTPNLTLGLGLGQQYGGMGGKVLFGVKNSGVSFGIGSIEGTMTYNLGIQIAFGQMYLSYNYGVIGVEVINNRSPDLIMANSIMLGAMLFTGSKKKFCLELGFGHTFGADETITPFDRQDNNRPVFALGLAYRL